MISDLEIHPPYPCEVNVKKVCVYKADFRYKNKQGETVVEDTKGIETPMFRLKKKLVEALYPDTEIIVVKKAKVRRAKLYYLRHRSGKATRLKQKFI